MSNIGGIVCAVMMQQLNKRHPDNYLLAMRILWAPIALMIIVCKYEFLGAYSPLMEIHVRKRMFVES